MKTVLCFGDSNTHGSDESGARHSWTVRWTGILAAALGPAVRVIEEGLPGRTTLRDDPVEDHSAARNGAAYLRPCLASHRPVDLVTLMLGTNDLKRRFDATAADIAQSVGELVRIVRRSEAGPAGGAPHVLVLAPAPIVEVPALIGGIFAGGAVKSRALAPLLAEIARQDGCTFLDTGPVWTVSPGDGVHFTAAEHAKLGAAMVTAVRGLLG